MLICDMCIEITLQYCGRSWYYCWFHPSKANIITCLCIEFNPLVTLILWPYVYCRVLVLKALFGDLGVLALHALFFFVERFLYWSSLVDVGFELNLVERFLVIGFVLGPIILFCLVNFNIVSWLLAQVSLILLNLLGVLIFTVLFVLLTLGKFGMTISGTSIFPLGARFVGLILKLVLLCGLAWDITYCVEILVCAFSYIWARYKYVPSYWL